MDSLLFYVPLYIGMGFAIFGIFYRRRHPDSPRALRVMAWSLTVALIVCLGTSAFSLVTRIAEGATGLIVPLLLVVALAVLALLTVRRGLREKPSTTETADRDDRRSSVRLTLILATIIALPAYAAGYGAGTWLMVIYPEAPRLDLILGVAAVSAVALALIPWLVIEVRAAARRRAVANGHPASPEIVDHVMTKAKAARLESVMSHSPFRTVIIWVISVFALLAIPAVMQLLLNQLDAQFDTAPSVDLSWVQVVTIAIALVLVVGGLILWFLVPTIRSANTELLLATLSAEQRLGWALQALPDGAARHRFPGRLVDPRRSVRVLTVTETGSVFLEHVAAGDLLLERSEPLNGGVDDRREDLVDVDEDDQLDARDEKILRVFGALVENAGDRRFDLFALDYSTQAHIVAVGADDYLDFPEDLARSLVTS